MVRLNYEHKLKKFLWNYQLNPITHKIENQPIRDNSYKPRRGMYSMTVEEITDYLKSMPMLLDTNGLPYVDKKVTGEPRGNPIQKFINPIQLIPLGPGDDGKPTYDNPKSEIDNYLRYEQDYQALLDPITTKELYYEYSQSPYILTLYTMQENQRKFCDSLGYTHQNYVDTLIFDIDNYSSGGKVTIQDIQQLIPYASLLNYSTGHRIKNGGKYTGIKVFVDLKIPVTIQDYQALYMDILRDIELRINPLFNLDLTKSKILDDKMKTVGRLNYGTSIYHRDLLYIDGATYDNTSWVNIPLPTSDDDDDVDSEIDEPTEQEILDWMLESMAHDSYYTVSPYLQDKIDTVQTELIRLNQSKKLTKKEWMYQVKQTVAWFMTGVDTSDSPCCRGVMDSKEFSKRVIADGYIYKMIAPLFISGAGGYGINCQTVDNFKLMKRLVKEAREYLNSQQTNRKRYKTERERLSSDFEIAQIQLSKFGLKWCTDYIYQHHDHDDRVELVERLRVITSFDLEKLKTFVLKLKNQDFITYHNGRVVITSKEIEDYCACSGLEIDKRQFNTILKLKPGQVMKSGSKVSGCYVELSNIVELIEVIDWLVSELKPIPLNRVQHLDLEDFSSVVYADLVVNLVSHTISL